MRKLRKEERKKLKHYFFFRSLARPLKVRFQCFALRCVATRVALQRLAAKSPEPRAERSSERAGERASALASERAGEWRDL